MKILQIAAFVAVATFGVNGYAQEVKPIVAATTSPVADDLYDGTWERERTDRLSQIILTLKGNSGAAEIFARAGNSNCFRGKVPVEISDKTVDSISVIFKHTTIAQQCADEPVTFNRVSEGGSLRLVSAANSRSFYVKK